MEPTKLQKVQAAVMAHQIKEKLETDLFYTIIITWRGEEDAIKKTSSTAKALELLPRVNLKFVNTEKGVNLLLACCIGGNEDVCDALLTRMKNQSPDFLRAIINKTVFSPSMGREMSPLAFAMIANMKRIIPRLLQEGANPSDLFLYVNPEKIIEGIEENEEEKTFFQAIIEILERMYPEELPLTLKDAKTFYMVKRALGLPQEAPIAINVEREEGGISPLVWSLLPENLDQDLAEEIFKKFLTLARTPIQRLRYLIPALKPSITAYPGLNDKMSAIIEEAKAAGGFNAPNGGGGAAVAAGGAGGGRPPMRSGKVLITEEVRRAFYQLGPELRSEWDFLIAIL